MKKNSSYFLIQLMIAAAILLCAEGILRVKGYPYPQTGVSHPVYHHTRSPNTVGRWVKPGEFSHTARINRHGMRDREDREIEKPENVFRVVLMGDSFTEGYGVADDLTFAFIAEKILNADSEKEHRFEVVNAGRIGYSPLPTALYYENFVSQFNADLVVLFFDWGDIHDDLRYEKVSQRDSNGRIIAVAPQGNPSAELRGLTAKSAILNYFYWEQPHEYIRRSFGAKILRPLLGEEGYDRLKQKFLPNISLGVEVGNVESDRYMIFREGDLEPLHSHISFTQKNIVRLYQAVKNNNSDFLLVLYPYGTQVNGEEWVPGRKFYGFESGRVYGSIRPFALFEEFASASGMETMNLLDDFQTAKERPLFYPEDGHWTEAGHVVVGASLVDKIQRIYQAQTQS